MGLVAYSCGGDEFIDTIDEVRDSLGADTMPPPPEELLLEEESINARISRQDQKRRKLDDSEMILRAKFDKFLGEKSDDDVDVSINDLPTIMDVSTSSEEPDEVVGVPLPPDISRMAVATKRMSLKDMTEDEEAEMRIVELAKERGMVILGEGELDIEEAMKGDKVNLSFLDRHTEDLTQLLLELEANEESGRLSERVKGLLRRKIIELKLQKVRKLVFGHFYFRHVKASMKSQLILEEKEKKIPLAERMPVDELFVMGRKVRMELETMLFSSVSDEKLVTMLIEWGTVLEIRLNLLMPEIKLKVGEELLMWKDCVEEVCENIQNYQWYFSKLKHLRDFLADLAVIIVNVQEDIQHARKSTSTAVDSPQPTESDEKKEFFGEDDEEMTTDA